MNTMARILDRRLTDAVMAALSEETTALLESGVTLPGIVWLLSPKGESAEELESVVSQMRDVGADDLASQIEIYAETLPPNYVAAWYVGPEGAGVLPVLLVDPPSEDGN